MTHADESLIEYPCDFPIKAMGLATDPIEEIVNHIVRRHLPHQQTFQSQHKNSSNGKFISITLVLEAQNRQQLDAIYQELSAHKKILMTL